MKRLISIISSLSFAALAVLTSCVQETPQTTVPVMGVSLMPKSVELVEGGSKVLTATVSPANATDKSVSFRSNEPSVATVDQDGIVKAISPGEAIVTVTTNDGNYKAHCTVTVVSDVIHVATVSLNESSITLKEGDSFTLVATVTPDNATDKSVSWSSDAESVASVSQDGSVKALKAGTATITVTTTDSGKSASCVVTVSATIGAVTVGSSNISCRNAKLSGSFNLSGELPSDLKYGVMYSTSPDVPEESAVTLKGTSYNVQDRSYSITTEVLEPETTYYYCAYVSTGGETIRGAVKSFEAKAVSSMIQTDDVTDVQSNTAVLNGSFDLTDCLYDKVEYGFELTPEGGSVSDIKVDAPSGKQFSRKVDGLLASKKYTASAYITLDGRRYTAEGKTFETSGGAVTGGSSNISCCSAKLSGSLNVSGELPQGMEYGVMYSKSSDVPESSAVRITGSNVQNKNFSVNASYLEPETKYYYCAYSTYGGVTARGAVNNFTTKPLSSMIQTNDATDVQLNAAVLNATCDLTDCLYDKVEYGFEITPEGATADTKISSNLGNKKFSYKLESLVYGKKYTVVAFVKLDDRKYKGNESSFVAGAVDLGLSVCWAACNVGASTPEAYGGYYQWAGAEDVTDTSINLDWSNCPYHSGSDKEKGWTKYNTQSSYGPVDNKTVLDPEDDIAHVKLGGKWRMPTEDEWDELKNTSNCSWTWTSINGVHGWKVQSKKTGFTENWIFLPAAGFRINDYFYNVGTGNYWSSSLNTDYPSGACYLDFGSLHVDTNYFGGRLNGRSVRPVSE